MARAADKRCLVTGASGLIGSQLVAELASAWEVHALSRTAPAQAEGLVRYPMDLTREWSTSGLPDRMEAVVYLAQSERFRDFPEAAEDVFQVNTVSALRALEYARRAGARSFIFASSGGVYGTGDDDFSEDLEISAEGDLGFYLATKVCTEILAANYTPYMNVIVLRFFFVYGPGQRRSMLIPRLVDSVQEGQPITLQGADGIKLNPIYVSDAAAAICAALDLEGSYKINVGGPEVLTLRQIGETIGEVVGREPVFRVEKEKQPRHLVGNITKMTELLGGPRVTFRQGVEMLLSPAVAS